MSNVYPLDRTYRVSPADNGNIAEFGQGDVDTVGTLGFMFVPDASWLGSLAVVARAVVRAPGGSTVPAPPFVQYPYRPGYLNDQVPAVPFSWETVPITGNSIVHVPSVGMSIGLLIQCSAGFGWLYSWPLSGPSAV